MFLVCDIESTGLNALGVEILTADFIYADENLEILEKKSYKVRPRVWDYSAEQAVEIHGITREEAYTYPPYHESIMDMFNCILTLPKGTHLVFHANRIHNTSYDASILRMHALDNGLYFDFGLVCPERLYISTHSMSKYLKVPSDKFNLKSLCSYYKLGEFEHHNSAEDAMMCYKLFKKMLTDINVDDFLQWEHFKGDTNERVKGITSKTKNFHRLI